MQTPFFYYSKTFPEFLRKNNLSIVLSTYQAGKLIIIGSSNGKSLQLFAKNFQRPMGIAIYDNQLAVASKSKIDLFVNSPSLANTYPQEPGQYDCLYVPQASYFTGVSDIHDIEWGNEGLWAVNTAFSCLCLMDEKFSFIPRWKPNFISELLPEDRCHLNGLAMKDGEPAYVTIFDKTDNPEGWRNGRTETGVILDVKNMNVIAEGLPIPHSPSLKDDSLFFLLSATGKVMNMDTTTGNIKEIAKLDNFLRGLAVYEDYLVVGGSCLRDSSIIFQDFEIKNTDQLAGIYILEQQTGKELAKLTFTDFIREIYSIKIIPNVSRAALISTTDEWAQKCIYTPDETSFWVTQKEIS